MDSNQRALHLERRSLATTLRTRCIPSVERNTKRGSKDGSCTLVAWQKPTGFVARGKDSRCLRVVQSYDNLPRTPPSRDCRGVIELRSQVHPLDGRGLSERVSLSRPSASCAKPWGRLRSASATADKLGMQLFPISWSTRPHRPPSEPTTRCRIP